MIYLVNVSVYFVWYCIRSWDITERRFVEVSKKFNLELVIEYFLLFDMELVF